MCTIGVLHANEIQHATIWDVESAKKICCFHLAVKPLANPTFDLSLAHFFTSHSILASPLIQTGRSLSPSRLDSHKDVEMELSLSRRGICGSLKPKEARIDLSKIMKNYGKVV